MTTFYNPGTDVSGNGNNWTPVNINWTATGTTYDVMTDVPTLTSATAANFATFNPVNNLSAATVSSANLNVTSSANWKAIFSTIGMTTGKFYCELTDVTTGGGFFFGVATASNISQAKFTDNNYIGKFSDDYGLRINDYGAGSSSNEGYSTNAVFTSLGTAQPSSGNIYGLAVDLDNRKIYWSKNGTWYNSANPSSGTNGISITSSVEYFIGASPQTPEVVAINFGQRPFSYSLPTGFVALNTYNLPTPTIGATASSQANKYFDATLYTGNGSTQTITNSGSMQPDLVWMKARSTSGQHALVTSTIGVGTQLSTNNTVGDQTATDGITSLNSNGFSLGAGSIGYSTNNNGTTYVGWQWRASNTTAVTNTAGSITSTVSANTTAGFSIVTYTGQEPTAGTIGHGLGVAPSLIITKNRSGVGNWGVYHKFMDASSPQSYYMQLNSTSARINATDVWNNTAPTSTVFSVGNAGTTNTNGASYVAYCFSEVAGFSKFGSYTGNGSTDGTFVYCGFKPKYVMFKRTDTTGNWEVFDGVRNPYNVTNLVLEPNNSGAEYTGTTDYALDLTSNGFKFRGTGSNINASSGTYIYMAFAESPFKYANAR